MEPKAHPEWKELFETLRNQEYDTFIPHERVESIIGHLRRTAAEKYYSIVERWKREMLEQASRQIENVHGKGYRIILPNEFRGSATKQIKFGHRRMRKAGKIIVNTPMERLTDEEKTKVGEMSVILSQVMHFSKATLKKVKEIDKKTDQILLDLSKTLEVGD
jgi:hypothetical protein